MHQQSSRTNGYPKSIRIYTIYGIGGKISTSTYRQMDNTSIATKPEETYMPHRNGTARMEGGIQLDKGTCGTLRK